MALLRGIFAEHPAIVTYSHYLGLAQLRTHAPGILVSDARVRGHVRLLEAALLADLK